MAIAGGISESKGVENSLEIDTIARFAIDEHNMKQVFHILILVYINCGSASACFMRTMLIHTCSMIYKQLVYLKKGSSIWSLRIKYFSSKHRLYHLQESQYLKGQEQ